MTHRVQRGGTWFYRRKQQAYLRLAYRRVDKAHYQDDLVGFRVVCLPPEVAPPRMLPPLRGGSWLSYPRFFRSACRNHFEPGLANYGIGFRVVCLPPEVVPPRMALRGGPWSPTPICCRSAYRGLYQPGYVSSGFGFRVVCVPPGAKPTQVTMRGGSHAQLSYPWCRSTCRGISHSPDYADYDLGFRVICLPRGMTP